MPGKIHVKHGKQDVNNWWNLSLNLSLNWLYQNDVKCRKLKVILVQWTGAFGLFSKIFLFVQCFCDSSVRYPAVYLCVPSFVSRNKIFCMNRTSHCTDPRNKGLQRVNYILKSIFVDVRNGFHRTLPPSSKLSATLPTSCRRWNLFLRRTDIFAPESTASPFYATKI